MSEGTKKTGQEKMPEPAEQHTEDANTYQPRRSVADESTYNVQVHRTSETADDFVQRILSESEARHKREREEAETLRNRAIYPGRPAKPNVTASIELVGAEKFKRDLADAANAAERVMRMETETTKIRKHNHDTLWAVLAGFAAASGLMVIMAAIVLAILSFTRGL